jgi:chloramphenicol 3-O-phosphotransferase
VVLQIGGFTQWQVLWLIAGLAAASSFSFSECLYLGETMREPSIILITGIMASGKSSVAQHLAERLEKSVHLRGDLFRRMIVNGRADIGSPLSDSALAQLRLRYQVAAEAAHLFCAAGFTVVYQDIILGPLLKDVVDMLRDRQPLYVIVLCPSPEVVAQRAAGRGKVAYTSWTPAALDQELRSNTPRLGLWLDSSTQSVEQTVDAILSRIENAMV